MRSLTTLPTTRTLTTRGATKSIATYHRDDQSGKHKSAQNYHDANNSINQIFFGFVNLIGVATSC